MKYGLVILLFIAACSPMPEGPNKFANDEQLVNIYEYQDQRDVESLLPLLKAKKEEHRVAAALAFASIQDTLAIPYLNQMLQIDQDHKARRAAAYALGQIRSPKAIGILKSAFDNELYNGNRPTILEAIGKCGDSSTVGLFEKVLYQDQPLQLGWAYGVLRLEQKGYSSENLKIQMTKYLASKNRDIALIASHYLYRSLRRSGSPHNIDSLAQLTQFDEVKTRLMLLEQLEVKQEKLNWDWTVEFNKLNPYQKSEKLLMLDLSNPKLIE
ncbi:MAG: HEAT repeat domain-containing protein, partial [Bacteroidia bacterium]